MLKRGHVAGFAITSLNGAAKLYVSNTSGAAADAAGDNSAVIGTVTAIPTVGGGVSKLLFVDVSWIQAPSTRSSQHGSSSKRRTELCQPFSARSASTTMIAFSNATAGQRAIYALASQYVAAQNDVIAGMLGTFVDETTDEYKRRYKLPGGGYCRSAADRRNPAP